MNRESISELIETIDDKYIFEAENYRTENGNSNIIIKGNFKNKILLTAASIALLLVSVFVFQKLVSKDNNNKNTPKVKENVYYSELTKVESPSFLNGLEIPPASGLADIKKFDETMLSGCNGIIEGTVDNAHIKKYEYTEPSNKFESDGKLYHTKFTVIYEITVDDVWYGEFRKGEKIIIEDNILPIEQSTYMNIGHRYVIPIKKSSDEITSDTGEKLEGEIKKESAMQTIYIFHPQIEAVEKGYIVSSDWSTLVAGEKAKIIMDTNNDSEFDYYKDKMYLISNEVFKTQMKQLITKL